MSDVRVDDLRERVIAALRKVHDPEIPINIYDLGLIYDLSCAPDGRVAIRMTLTTPNCPVADAMPSQVQRVVKEVEGVSDAQVELVWDPPWSRERMSERARLALAMNDIGPTQRGFVPAGSLRKPRNH